jgi:murein DD-endopeptidase MepM/ murein hydrolase activator NlpD
LGGHNVGVLGDDGLTYYYAHFKNAPRVKAGQRVGAGQQLGDVGRSGNAANTPPHLHIGIGQGIQTGAGAQGGLGRGFDAVDYLRRTLTGAAPAHRDAPPVGALASPTPEAAPDWYRRYRAQGGN